MDAPQAAVMSVADFNLKQMLAAPAPAVPQTGGSERVQTSIAAVIAGAGTFIHLIEYGNAVLHTS